MESRNADSRTGLAARRGELVAREAEFERLLGARREAGEGRGSIVLVAGEAGIGKSRLLHRFESVLVGGRAAHGIARCVEFAQTPFAPLRESLQNVAQNAAGTVGADPGVRRLIERLTFERAGEPSETPSAGWLFEMIDSTFARLAARRTLVILIEDLHWADRSTLPFCTYLADRIASRRMLVVATYRSEKVDATHPRLAEFATLLGKAAITSLPLRPLDPAATRRLLEAALPSPAAVDEATLTDLVRRSEGNPFFAEELLKSALESRGRDHRLPLSIRGAILARARPLSKAECDVLSLAAALGERFSIERLTTLLERPRDDVLATLERARALQLVRDEREAPGELAFRHALTQEVFYGELLAERVRPLHERIGRELEMRADRDAVIVELAHHWWRAGDPARATTYLESAGDRASALGAVADALVYYERTLELRYGDDAMRARVEHKIGVALGFLGQPAAGILRLHTAAALYQRLGDVEGFARNASALGAQLHNSGDMQAAVDVWREALEAGAERISLRTRDLLRARMAYSCVAMLDFETALEVADQIREPDADPQTASLYYESRFKISAMNGDVDRWLREIDLAAKAARKMNGNPFVFRKTDCQIALDAVGLGENERAELHFVRTGAARVESYTPFRALVFSAWALARVLRGDFAAAAKMLQRARSLASDEYASGVHLKSAQLALGICRGDDASTDWDDTEPLLYYGVGSGMQLVLGLVGGPYALTLGLSGEIDKARAWIRRIAAAVPGPHRFSFAFLAAAQFGLPEDVLTLRRSLAAAAANPKARVSRALFDLYDAVAGERGLVAADVPASACRAAEGFDAIGWPWFSARSLELAGDVERALSIYRRLGALRDLRRLESTRAVEAERSILSPREREVAELIARAMSNEEIARSLGISRRTVEKHVSSALEKLSFTSRAQLSLFFSSGNR